MVSRLLSLKRGNSNPIFQGAAWECALGACVSASIDTEQSRTGNLRNDWVLAASTLMLSFALQISESLTLNGLPRQHLEGSLDLIDRRFKQRCCGGSQPCECPAQTDTPHARTHTHRVCFHTSTLSLSLSLYTYIIMCVLYMHMIINNIYTNTYVPK